MNLQDMLDKACGDLSDNKTSQKLGITRSTFSSYRTGRKLPSDEVLEKMIEIGGINPVEAYLAVYAERVQNPIVAAAFRHMQA
jgi:transcriptional regulator with XRE-family HTH domain